MRCILFLAISILALQGCQKQNDRSSLQNDEITVPLGSDVQDSAPQPNLIIEGPVPSGMSVDITLENNKKRSPLGKNQK